MIYKTYTKHVQHTFFRMCSQSLPIYALRFINHTSVWTCVGCRLVWLQVYSVSTCASCIVMRSYHLCCLVLPASSLGFSTSLTFLYLPMLEECVYHCASTPAMWITQIIGLMQNAAPFAAKLATLRS